MVNQTVTNYYGINETTSVGVLFDNFDIEGSDGMPRPVVMYALN
jgi:hypothetical protein